jgi:hypothetical protein
VPPAAAAASPSVWPWPPSWSPAIDGVTDADTMPTSATAATPAASGLYRGAGRRASDGRRATTAAATTSSSSDDASASASRIESWSDAGTPIVRDPSHTAKTPALTAAAASHGSGRLRHRASPTATASCSHATTRKNTPWLVCSSKCDGA